jgi:hypothetical protein
MKKKDIALLVAVGLFAASMSVLVSQVFIKSGENRQMEAQVVQTITTDFQKPDERVFNKDAINPTQLIQIGNNSNNDPF